MSEYVIGQIFIDEYPEDAADFCNAHELMIEEIAPEGGHRRFQIQEIPEPSEPTVEEKLKALEHGVEAYIDSVVRLRGYNNIYTCISHMSSKIAQKAKDAEVASDWRDQVWVTCNELVAEYMGGQIGELTLEQVIAELPVIQWVEVNGS